MFKINVDYPTKSDELEIVNRMGHNDRYEIKPVITRDDLLRASNRVDQVYVDAKVKNYIVEIVMASRKPTEYGIGSVANLLSVGGSPRASISLIRASKAHAFIRGRGYVTAEDIKAVAYNVLRHRFILTYEAEAENIKTDEVIKEILSHIEV